MRRRKVMEKHVECTYVACRGETAASSEAVTTSGDALHLAIMLAVNAGEYERAGALLDVPKRTTDCRGS